MKYALIVLALVVLLCTASMAQADLTTAKTDVTLNIQKYVAFVAPTPSAVNFTASNGQTGWLDAVTISFPFIANCDCTISVSSSMLDSSIGIDAYFDTLYTHYKTFAYGSSSADVKVQVWVPSATTQTGLYTGSVVATIAP